jgi:hypothetical protein
MRQLQILTFPHSVFFSNFNVKLDMRTLFSGGQDRQKLLVPVKDRSTNCNFDTHGHFFSNSLNSKSNFLFWPYKDFNFTPLVYFFNKIMD